MTKALHSNMRKERVTYHMLICGLAVPMPPSAFLIGELGLRNAGIRAVLTRTHGAFSDNYVLNVNVR